MFIDEIKSYDWKSITDSIYSKTAADVEIALAKNQRNFEDFKALISPAAAPYLEQMAALSHQLTQKRFGKNIQLYVPLYLSNFCENRCVYCGFNAENKITRKVLSEDEIVAEMDAISEFGFKHLLLVTGEASKKAGIDYLKKSFELIKPKTSLISIEVQPLEEQGYKDLVDAGLHTVYLYQETYNYQTYKDYHLGGKKADFDYRIDAYERMGRAGVYKIGLGILAGLEDWRTDSFYTALHLKYLQKKYWKTKYSVSFPRLRPHAGAFEPKSIMNDRDLAQLMFAYRIFDEDVELALSTRESRSYRDHMVKLGVTSMSAGSKTNPGGYSSKEETLEQFSVDDNREPDEIAQMIRKAGYEAVWKDWDFCLQ